MKKITFLLALLCVFITANAYDFMVDGLCYQINGPNVTLVQSDDYATTLNGAVDIPSMVSYNGASYTVTQIGTGAFKSCKGLTSLNIPATVTYIGHHMVDYCDNLTSLTVDENNTIYDSRDNCNAVILKSLRSVYRACNATVIPSSVQAIDYQSFYGCTGITSIDIPENVQHIYNGAFSHCENLASINLPSNLRTIDSGAFQYCKSLTSITIPASVISINGKGQTNTANRGPFFCCDNLETIVVEEGNPNYDSRDNCNAVIETATNTLIFGCKGSTFPASVIIGKGSFKECTMTSLDIPEGVTTIEENAFNSCHSLETVTLHSVTFIGQFAFSYCDKLKTLTLPASLDTISHLAFLDCTSLANVYAYPAGGNVGLGSSVWTGVPQADCNLHVYPQDFNYYSTADQWIEFNVKGDLDAQKVYILGEVDKNGWAPNVGKLMDLGENGLYTAVITCDGRNSGYNFFSFTTELAENNDDGGWAYIAPFRFGAVSNGDFDVTDEMLGRELSLTYENGQAFMIPEGEYKLSLNLEDMKLVITKNIALFGDVDLSGKVDVTDVNILVNIVLGKDSADNYDGRAFITEGDTVVDVSDINALVNILLGKGIEE